MKEYISRLKSGGKTYVFITWWVLRIIMLGVFVATFFADTFTLTGKTHIAVCFVASFGWELCQSASGKSLFRHIPASIHTAANVGLFVSAVFGIYFNLYYTTWFFDPLLQAFFGFLSVLYGYEIAYAMVKRDRFSATKAMVFFVAFGIGFICFNAWELGEFFTDQLIGHLTGEAGNAQFWSEALAEGTARAESMLSPIVPEREPLMDLMGDIIVHFLSSFAALIFINLFPYRLRGKYKYDIEYGNNAVKSKENADSRK